MKDNQYVEQALAEGFTKAVFLNQIGLECKPELRAYCNPQQCPNCGKNWVCPPGCGTLEECQAKLNRFHQGLLVQSVTDLTPPTSRERYSQLAAEHGARLRKLTAALRMEKMSMLILSYGGCNLCSQCSFPAPCVHPDERMESLGAYGIDVGQLCAAAEIPYAFGEERLYMTALILLSSEG